MVRRQEQERRAARKARSKTAQPSEKPTRSKIRATKNASSSAVIRIPAASKADTSKASAEAAAPPPPARPKPRPRKLGTSQGQKSGAELEDEGHGGVEQAPEQTRADDAERTAAEMLLQMGSLTPLDHDGEDEDLYPWDVPFDDDAQGEPELEGEAEPSNDDSDSSEDKEEEEDGEGSADDHSDDVDEDKPFDFVVGVPVGGAMSMMEVSSAISWARFQKKVAAKLDVDDIEDLALGWKLSTQPKSEIPKLLDSPLSFKKIIDEMTAYHTGKRKSRSTRALEVHLVDLREKESKGKGKALGKGKKGAHKSSRKRKNESESDEDESTPPSTVKIVTALQQKYRCEACNSYCWVTASDNPNEAGQHHKLTHSNLAYWAREISLNLCTYDIPPATLKIHDVPLRPRGKAAASSSTAAAPANSLAGPAASPVNPHPPYPYPFYPFAPPMPWAPPAATGPSTSLGVRSSSPAAGVDDPTIYQRISEWLLSLDQGPRGADKRDFSRFAPFFEAEGFCRIIELQNETFESLQSFCPGLNRGTASALLAYAKADIDAAQKDLRREQKRARRFL